MSDTGLALQVFMSGDDDIIVKDGWKPQPGQPMPQMAGVFVGKQFGAGALSFNTIFDLVDQDGKTTDQALKVCKPTLAARRSLAHEWKMFKDLSLLAAEFEAARSHFLQARRVVRLHDGRIAGIVMEKANGHNVDKTLKDPNFCNVRYVISLLRDLLVGLDVAQRVLGFTHYDLKLDNVMEHWNADPEAGKARLAVDAVPQFKIFDFGTAVVYPDPFSMHTAVDENLHEHKPDAAPHLAEQRPHNRRGKITRGNADSHNYEYSTPFCCVRIYHMWWKQRGDVFRVLSSLCKHLDDRTWPTEDIELVSLLFTVLEHATNSKRLKARFVPRSVLLHRIYGPNPPPPPKAPSLGLTRAQTQAILQQHSALVLQGSSSVRQGSTGAGALPSAASIEAYGRQQQRHAKAKQLQGVAEGDGEGEEQQMGLRGVPGQNAAQSAAAAAVPLRINTTKLPAGSGPVAATHDTSAARAAAAPASSDRSPILPPPSPTGAGGGAYTPRRSTEVSRDDLNSSTVPGMRYVRLTKAAEPAAAAPTGSPAGPTAAGAGAGAAMGSTGGLDAGRPASPPAPPSPFAGYGQGGAQAFGGSSSSSRSVAGCGSNGAGVGGGVPGVMQMVGGRQGGTAAAAVDPRSQQQQQYATSIQVLQQQQYSQQDQQRSAAVAAATNAVAPATPNPPDTFHVAAAPEGVPDVFAPPPTGMSSTTPPKPKAETQSDPHRPHRNDSAGTVVRKQPVADAEQQSVLGSRKALRGVTAQQLLVEPVVQSLLSKV